jgi:DHA1 family bicyclomycin/chloramphenicol resistance-like MFS transporter
VRFCSPFAYVTYYHVSTQTYGLLFGLSVVGIMAANLINARLVVGLGADRLLRWGTLGAAAAGLLLAAMARTGWGGLWGLVLPLFAFASATGFIAANSITNALARRPDRAGAVSALVGAAQYGAGVASSALVGAFADGTPWPMGWVIAAAGLGSALSSWALSRRLPDTSL